MHKDHMRIIYYLPFSDMTWDDSSYLLEPTILECVGRKCYNVPSDLWSIMFVYRALPAHSAWLEVTGDHGQDRSPEKAGHTIPDLLPLTHSESGPKPNRNTVLSHWQESNLRPAQINMTSYTNSWAYLEEPAHKFLGSVSE